MTSFLVLDVICIVSMRTLCTYAVKRLFLNVYTLHYSIPRNMRLRPREPRHTLVGTTGFTVTCVIARKYLRK